MVNGSFVLRQGVPQKVPTSPMEAFKSPLMGLFEKRRAASFLGFVRSYDPANPKTWKKMKPKEQTMKQLFDAWSIEPLTREFIGHAVALHTDDSYLDRPAHPTLLRCQLYNQSIARYMSQQKPGQVCSLPILCRCMCSY